MDSLQLAARNLQVARVFRSAGQYDGVKFTAQILDGDIVSDLSVGNELHAFGRHLLQAAIDDVLLQLEFGDAVTQQATDAVCFLMNRHVVSGPCYRPLVPEPRSVSSVRPEQFEYHQ